MNILYLHIEPFYPKNSGMRVNGFNILKMLSLKNNVYFYALIERGEEEHKEQYKEICKDANFYIRQKSHLKFMLNFWRPYTMVTRFNSRMRDDIKKCVRDNGIDVIITSYHMVLNIDKEIKLPIVIQQDNYEAELFKRIAAKEKRLVKKIVYSIESFKFMNFDRKVKRGKTARGCLFRKWKILA